MANNGWTPLTTQRNGLPDMAIMKEIESRPLAASAAVLVDYSSDSSESDSDPCCNGVHRTQSLTRASDPPPVSSTDSYRSLCTPQDGQDRDRDRPAAGIPLLPRSKASSAISTPPNGQWPIHIHVPLGQLPNHLTDLIDKLLEDVRQSISDLVSLVPWQSGSSNSSSQLHISLSRAGTWLPRAQLATCVAMIQADLAHQRPVQVQFGRVSHLINDTGSRRFVVLECTAGQVGLARWVRVVDQVLEKQLGRKPFYDKPRFHVSIGYVEVIAEDGSDPDGATRWDELMDRLTLKYGQQLTEFVLKLGRIEVRTGERVYNVDVAD
ncbi:hypothetical protein BCR44DRAFT_40056 [Catenaria anguillulae PL171]|uniref:U6 snRNA phosphodiesterase 1 n=1 Tax=Catenaria anguillulae PL171 TaxID=765915 RepID=A0A1Y2HYE1_9FUNG|nr:hypothetical protein BCR44DRAFT_40056 [Catenaria anguillulae PL171]